MQRADEMSSASISLLTRAQTLCKQWDREQTKSNQLFQSLSNFLAQQTAAENMSEAMSKRHGIDPARLMYKQMLEFEKAVEQLSIIVEQFHTMVDRWKQLERDANKHLSRTTGDLTQRSLKKDPTPLSTASLIQVAEIKPDHVQLIVGQLCSMYQREYAFKRTLFDSLPTSCSNAAQLDSLAERWDSESHILVKVQEEMAERLVLYKHVKNVLESDDFKV